MENSEYKAVLSVVEYLNKVTESSFRPFSSSTQTPILARIREGFTQQDMEIVIDTMAKKWLGNEKMEVYLRPQTLFGNKFEGYLQEARRKAQKKQLPKSSGFASNAKELLE